MDKEKSKIPPSTYPSNILHNEAHFIHRRYPLINSIYNLLRVTLELDFIPTSGNSFILQYYGPLTWTNNISLSPNCWVSRNFRIYINSKPKFLWFTPFHQIRSTVSLFSSTTRASLAFDSYIFNIKQYNITHKSCVVRILVLIRLKYYNENNFLL